MKSFYRIVSSGFLSLLMVMLVCAGALITRNEVVLKPAKNELILSHNDFSSLKSNQFSVSFGAFNTTSSEVERGYYLSKLVGNGINRKLYDQDQLLSDHNYPTELSLYVHRDAILFPFHTFW